MTRNADNTQGFLKLPAVLCAVSKVSVQLKRFHSHYISKVFCTQPRFLVYLNTLSSTLFILGYHYWKFVADHVGLKEEKKNWEQSDNPAEKFLHAFSVKEHSTIGKLIEACGEEAGLTLLVSELKRKFSAANQSESLENLAPNGSTWV